jgi:hypothetical protein
LILRHIARRKLQWRCAIEVPFGHTLVI